MERQQVDELVELMDRSETGKLAGDATEAGSPFGKADTQKVESAYLARSGSKEWTREALAKVQGVQSPSPMHLVGLGLGAFLVGASVSIRLWLCVHLSKEVEDMDALLASVHVTARAMALSLVFLAPFASCKALPRTCGPWLAGLCTLPTASLIETSEVLGLGLTQMVLKLSTVSTALCVDAATGRLKSLGGVVRQLLGAALVLGGVAAAASDAFGADLAVSGAVLALCVLGTAASGAGFVVQAWLSAPSAAEAAPESAAQDLIAPAPESASSAGLEAAAAFACQAVSAAAQLVLLLSLVGRQGLWALGAFPMLAGDMHLWLAVGAQGAFFLRAMQVLGKRLGLAPAFMASLCGQLTTALVLDYVSGEAAFTPRRLLGLALVVLGAGLSSCTIDAQQKEDD